MKTLLSCYYLCLGGDLFDRIISKGHYKEDEVFTCLPHFKVFLLLCLKTKVVMKQILEAIRFLHLHKIAHRYYLNELICFVYSV